MDSEQTTPVERKIRECLERRQLEEAAELALASYGPEILGYLVRVMDDEQDAREVYAQFCEDLWRGLRRFRGGSSLRTWAYHLARNARNRFWKDGFRRLGRRLETGEAARLQALARSTTAIYQRTAVKDRLAVIREQLDPDERELLILRVDRRMSWNEIASVLAEGKPAADEALRAAAATYRQRFRRLHSKIRTLFQEQGGIESDAAAPGDRPARRDETEPPR